MPTTDDMLASTRSKTNLQHRRSFGRWCQDFWLNVDACSASLARFAYNRSQGEIFGRDGKRWSKLAAFYFFFYAALGGFFCFYLSIYMATLPLDRPRYIGKASRFASRANPLSPGLSFRPWPKTHPNDMHAVLRLDSNESCPGNRVNGERVASYVKNLDEYFTTYYSIATPTNFTINDVGDCRSSQQYGFEHGKPCVLIKVNKIVDFVPESGVNPADEGAEAVCGAATNLPLRCQGEKDSDREKLGAVQYYSESGPSDVCGAFDLKHFPYKGKVDRKEVYQAPYVWAQFVNLTSNVLITVECRIFGANLFHERMAERASVRFQLYLNKVA